MSNFIQARQPDTPRQLYHYTKLAYIYNMIDVRTRSICFWLKNNKDKNDKKELKYGRELMEKVREYYRSIGQPSLLEQMTDFDNSYSASFTEGVLDAHMLGEYGTVRLEFDLRGYKDEKTKEEMKGCCRRIKELRDWNKLGRFNVMMRRIK